MMSGMWSRQDFQVPPTKCDKALLSKGCWTTVEEKFCEFLSVGSELYAKA